MIKVDSIVTIMHAAGNNTFTSSLILTSFITIVCSPKHPSCMYFITITANGTAKQYCMLHKNKQLCLYVLWYACTFHCRLICLYVWWRASTFCHRLMCNVCFRLRLICLLVSSHYYFHLHKLCWQKTHGLWICSMSITGKWTRKRWGQTSVHFTPCSFKKNLWWKIGWWVSRGVSLGACWVGL
jgi:hypothetical protein